MRKDGFCLNYGIIKPRHKTKKKKTRENSNDDNDDEVPMENCLMNRWKNWIWIENKLYGWYLKKKTNSGCNDYYYYYDVRNNFCFY